VTDRGDDNAVMKLTRYTYDDVVEAIVRGDMVPGAQAPLATFAREVRALADEPVPAPSAELTALLEGDAPGVARLARPAAKVAGLSLLAKIGLGASLAAASVAGAGAAGVLPAAANDAVRGAIEGVTPVDFSEPEEHAPNFGDRVSTDATGESDGEHGVDGQTISDEAPGAAHRNGGSAPDAPPGQTGMTGLDRANQTPAAANAPDPGTQGNGEDDSDDEDEPGSSGDADHGPPPSTPGTVPPAHAGG
jgi:hypothetical protein